MERIGLKSLALFLLSQASILPAFAEEPITIDKFRAIEGQVRAAILQGGGTPGFFILQRPNQPEKHERVFCGWIQESTDRDQPRTSRLFLYTEPEDESETPSVIIDRPEKQSLLPNMVEIVCFDAGYIPSRFPVGAYSDDFVKRYANGMQNNFGFMNE